MVAPVDCPEIECWQALFGDSLTEAERERYERHLESCPTCQERAHRAEHEDGLRRLGRAVGDPTVAPTDPTLAGILEKLHDSKPPEQGASPKPVDLYFLRPSDRPELLGTLGAYEVQGVIGQGGMGVVLKAFDPGLHRLVAIKVMAAAIAGSATARIRFEREAKAAAAVSHDHIVTVHGVHEADGLPYLVMQYIAGESLQERIDRDGPLELTEIARIGLQTASALAAAHAQGLIHRDIKPANILLENGVARVKITDFGLARMVDDAALTQSGTVAGTPEFIAPEQARGEQVDHRADLFSLGSVLYAMCTGRPPFRGSTTLAVLRRVMEEAPPPIHELNPDVPVWLESLVNRLLAKDPADRLQTAAETAALLEAYLAHLRQPATVTAPNLSAPRPGAAGRRGAADIADIFWLKPRPRTPLLIATAAMALLAISMWVLLRVVQQGEPPPANQPAFDQPLVNVPPEEMLALLLKLNAQIHQRGFDGAVVGVSLQGKPATDKDLRGISAFPHIKTLNVEGTQVTDAGLREIGMLTELEELWLGRNSIGDAGVKHLARLRKLKKLGLDATLVTDGCAKDLAGFTSLEYLNVGRTRFTDAGVKQLVPLTELKMLCLYSTGVTDEGVKQLSEFAKLEKLMISNTVVSDVSIKTLAKLKELRDVEMMGTNVTPEGQKELETAIPGIAVRASLGAPGGPTGSQTSPFVILVLGEVAIVLVFGAVCYYVRRREQHARQRTPLPSFSNSHPNLSKKEEGNEPDHREGGAAALPMIGLQCPGCRQNLKVRAELAGKNVVCPKCGQPVLVPAIKVAGT